MDKPNIPFPPFPKIPRLFRDMVITEKLDGTNASVLITEPSELHERGEVFAASRNRWITPENDNYGFAKWVETHADELRQLGPGQHFGEWWGQGIQRGYGLQEKRFSLFNVGRWDRNTPAGTPPACCHLVPVLRRFTFDESIIHDTLALLKKYGSTAAPGFMQPEGIVIFHAHAKQLFKYTLDHNDGHKG